MSVEPKTVLPDDVLKQVVEAIPAPLRSQIVIIGSLAAAYWFADKNPSFSVRTKDIDGVVTPRSSARATSEAMAEQLLASGWQPRREGKFASPGTAETPEQQLPALRLHPRGNADWFLELLTEPDTGSPDPKNWMRFVLSNGEHYGLPSFRFTSIATFDAPMTRHGVRAALPEMMALANLLEHPRIKPDLIDGTNTKRSNKDLGRVLALAWMSENTFEQWAPPWSEAIRSRFPEQWRELAAMAGDGLRELLDSPGDLQQAAANCNTGLLASRNVTTEQLGLTGARLIAFAIDDLKRLAETR